MRKEKQENQYLNYQIIAANKRVLTLLFFLKKNILIVIPVHVVSLASLSKRKLKEKNIEN